MPGEPGQAALQLAYTVANVSGEDGQETPEFVSLSNDSICKLPALSKDKAYVCKIRIKASQPRTARLFIVDQEREFSFTAQQLVTAQWQTLSIPMTKNFWNAWYDANASGSHSHYVDFPLSALRFDFICRQSAGQFKGTASGKTTNPPEKTWIESVKIFAPSDSKKN